MKIRPVGTELFHADAQTHRQAGRRADGRTDGQTDKTKLVVAFCNFAKAPKIFLKFESTALNDTSYTICGGGTVCSYI
jgi:hypothetical protein